MKKPQIVYRLRWKKVNGAKSNPLRITYNRGSLKLMNDWLIPKIGTVVLLIPNGVEIDIRLA